ncbi:hypothetical protein [Microaceticoccus formicicus]|uniref:hypothetical protein n=1 Tax=Microaceticoccus formicicus TaxID=3118105 RepID=UPI003CD02DB3|nr:hypothetical protein VZL98_09105 [Peptoniphilaceae bacterium AMB_02]
MQKMLVIDYSVKNHNSIDISQKLQCFQEVDYFSSFDLDNSSKVINNPNEYNTILLIQPHVSVLSNLSGLYSCNLVEKCIVEHILNEKELLIDFSELNLLDSKLGNNRLKHKIKDIKKSLNEFGVIDIESIYKNSIMQNGERDSNVGLRSYITLNDLKKIINGNKLILDFGSKLTPLARDYVKEKSILIQYKSVGE